MKKGEKHTEESKEKLRQFRTGMKLSEEHKAKISKGLGGNTIMVGRKLSEDAKKKISEAGMGNKNASKNPNVSEEERKKRSEASKERWRQYRISKGLDPDKPIDKRYK